MRDNQLRDNLSVPLARNIEFYAALARKWEIPFPLRYDVGLRVTSRPWSKDILLGIRINKVHTMYKMPLPRDTEQATIERFITDLRKAAVSAVSKVLEELDEMAERASTIKRFREDVASMAEGEWDEAAAEAAEAVRKSLFLTNGGKA